MKVIMIAYSANQGFRKMHSNKLKDTRELVNEK